MGVDGVWVALWRKGREERRVRRRKDVVPVGWREGLHRGVVIRCIAGEMCAGDGLTEHIGSSIAVREIRMEVGRGPRRGRKERWRYGGLRSVYRRAFATGIGEGRRRRQEAHVVRRRRREDEDEHTTVRVRHFLVPPDHPQFTCHALCLCLYLALVASLS